MVRRVNQIQFKPQSARRVSNLNLKRFCASMEEDFHFQERRNSRKTGIRQARREPSTAPPTVDSRTQRGMAGHSPPKAAGFPRGPPSRPLPGPPTPASEPGAGRGGGKGPTNMVTCP